MAYSISDIAQLLSLDNREKVRTFDPKQVIVTFGLIVMSGFAPDTFISIDPEGDDFRVIRGTGGNTDRVKIGTGNNIVTLSLLQTSPINDALSIVRGLDVVGNAGVFPLLIKDVGGTQAFYAPKAFIMAPPNMSMGSEVGTRDWRFYCVEATNHIGGNNVFF